MTVGWCCGNKTMNNQIRLELYWVTQSLLEQIHHHPHSMLLPYFCDTPFEAEVVV